MVLPQALALMRFIIACQIQTAHVFVHRNCNEDTSADTGLGLHMSFDNTGSKGQHLCNSTTSRHNEMEALIAENAILVDYIMRRGTASLDLLVGAALVKVGEPCLLCSPLGRGKL